MFKILTKKEYEEIINTINNLTESNNELNKKIIKIEDKVYPKYFGGAK